ncbi:MotA/TolQ/ExbB proton channel family protein [Hydrogenovibrio sp. 3SP14C1]|uniref:motility-associated protein n=1 Tax=Hydrogenovibrio sp. 3SP14C1 TaxID=3038774 RepID=UPI0024174D9F|nr:motility-associated protein [Hydrogenovibrio sp. 3SP14C1]MDG4812045.1 MotA/TolQ/ExbB proton channel family protein [Hydrogenovibrio sp. 3SP14C1]
MISKPFAILVVLGSSIGGFLMAGGNLISLWHPAELVVIIGLGLGVFLGSTPVYIWTKTMTYLGRYFGGGRVNKKIYIEVLGLLDELSRLARSQGLLALENHVVAPESSSIFAKYPLILKHKELKKFIVDNFGYLLLNPPQALSFENYLHDQIEDITQSMMEVPKATGKIANLMPGFGIIAAVMGVILTMNLLGGDMDVAKIGNSIGAALVGTLTGIFVAFSIIAPFTHAVEVMIRQDKAIFVVVASFLTAFAHGVSPSMALEVGRQRIPAEFEVPREG